MPVLIDNFHWMSWNVLLAVLPIIFSYLSIRYPKRFVGFIFFILWFLFFPNNILFIFNFLVAYAVVLGKVQRAESWDIIFNFNRLINEIVRSFSVTNTVVFIVLFGIFINAIWFFGREKVKDPPFHL